MHDDLNRLASDDDFTYAYDDSGNLTQKTATSGGQTTTYHWDARNRLAGISLPGGQNASYRYDALGRRVEKTAGTAATRYVYDGEDIALETDGTGTLRRRYRHGDGIDQPLVAEDVAANESYFFHADHLGSIRLVTDEAGDVASEYDYDAYGRRTAVSESFVQPYSYTGREWDGESGLYYYRARYYDPALGRFLSEDPIGFAGGDLNLYRYVTNDPLGWRDPTGTSKFDKFFGLPKAFWQWYHRQYKSDGDPDLLSRKEAKELFEEWKRMGKPKPDNKGRHGGEEGFVDPFLLMELWLPAWLCAEELGDHPCEREGGPPCGEPSESGPAPNEDINFTPIGQLHGH